MRFPTACAAGAAALALVLAAGACTVPGGAADTLRVLAGSEIADLEPLLEEVSERTGVTVELDYTGTLDGLARVAGGDTDGYDAVWFGSNRYLHLDGDGRTAVHTETPVMVSPVVLGVTESRADELGWTGGAEVTWADVSRAVAEEGLTYGMTHPGASNSGFSALIGVASALADTGSALESRDVERVRPELEEFFGGQEVTAGSSGWLSEAFERRAREGRPVDGLINYESVLLSLNASGALEEPLALVHPADGAVTADYPLTLLADPSEDAVSAYGRLVEDLLSGSTQQRIADDTWRRPVSPDAVLRAQAPPLVELPFPAHRQVVDDLVADYVGVLRRPARTVYVLDVSGSMEGERIRELQSALVALTGADGGSLARRTQAFQEREEITLLPFATEPGEPRTFVMEPGSADAVAADVAEEVRSLEADGETATYDALREAYALLEGGSGDHLTSVVLMTDGEVNLGSDLEDFRLSLEGLSPEAAAAPVFTVLFGDSDESEMSSVAEVTGGRVFDAREQDLEQIFREIRGYQ
ncbi:VWA domain-containing protein [Nocardiopsis tropica]|uniref:VWA domain-containing protein n=1 Tax=Nocardiopsis tropica TaxID=109330 RepID=A0ABU7KWE0_9ACTN|nr:VWA domain-containing protein [Nocardiopsis umidischolae]MEE2053606.1 VWA domain-containing protein [Nocardiopsis umidischolae]